MSFVRYTVARSEIPASPTRVGSSQDFNLRLISLTRSRQVTRNESIALGGDQETVLFRGEGRWQFTSAAIQRGTTEFLQWREFLDSGEGGEQFSFDPYGSVGDSPADLRAVKLTSKGYTEQRVVRRGAGGGGDYFRFTATVREL